jgi:hypothetical protein
MLLATIFTISIPVRNYEQLVKIRKNGVEVSLEINAIAVLATKS